GRARIERQLPLQAEIAVDHAVQPVPHVAAEGVEPGRRSQHYQRGVQLAGTRNLPLLTRLLAPFRGRLFGTFLSVVVFFGHHQLRKVTAEKSARRRRKGLQEPCQVGLDGRGRPMGTSCSGLVGQAPGSVSPSWAPYF